MSNTKQLKITIGRERQETFLGKIRGIKGTFYVCMHTIKDKQDKDLTEKDYIKKR